MSMLHKRKLVIKPESASPATQKEIQERYYVNLVMNNTHYRQIIASISEGTSTTEIARYFAMQGWTTVNERTFCEALRTFKRLKSELIASSANSAIGSMQELSLNQPSLDEIATLEQLLRLQRIRLGIDLKSEVTIGKLFNTTAREVEVTRRIAETLAKARGKIKDGSGGGMETASQDVLEDLSRLKKDETTRDRLHSLTSELAKANKE